MPIARVSTWRDFWSILVVVVAGVLLAACDGHRPTDEAYFSLATQGLSQSKQTVSDTQAVLRDAEKFLGALLAQDQEALRAYDGSVFFDSNGIRPEIRDFLYESKGEWRSIIEISRLGEIRPVVVPQGNGTIIVLYVPSIYESEVSNAGFLSEQWMKKYFACHFILEGSHWMLYENFCFAETDGPYPPDIG